MVPKAIAADDRRKVFSVGELTRLIKTTLENEVGTVWVEGELSNVHHHTSGHVYFTLKDESSQIQGALFRGDARGLAIRLADGQKVRVYGEITAYVARSQYQIIARRIEAAGKGSLQEQFEKLKAKLAAEGLFEAARKKPLPLLPQHIGVVTSPTGAALRDMLKVLGRRFPNLHIVVAPARVQGEGAAQEIAAAIELLNRRGGIDVMIVGRGGGSLEDLWPFNEEIVARAIAASRIPVISAVGHEVDFTISDFVADLRAPTPSAAAELVIATRESFEEKLRTLGRHLGTALRTRHLEYRERLTRASRSYVFREPRNLVERHRLLVDRLRERMAAELRHTFVQSQQRVDELSLRLRHRVEMQAKHCAQRIERLHSQLRALSPAAVLERGYSITLRGAQVLRRSGDVAEGDLIETRLARGSVASRVTKAGKVTEDAEGQK
jgi:exodeoxyribonuclease VII large subunit